MKAPSRRSTVQRLAIAVFSLIALIVVFVGTLALAMWREHGTAIALPEPSGPLAVGRTTFAWTTTAGQPLMVWVWYPAVRTSGEIVSEYLPASWRAAVLKQQGPFMRSFFKRDPAAVRPNSVTDASMAQRGRAPVVLLRPGGSALTIDFTTLAEDLASQGLVVVGFDAPSRSFVFVRPDGEVVPRAPGNSVENANGDLKDPMIGRLLTAWVDDARFVLNELARRDDAGSWRFAGRLNMERVGMVGHSFGGATALELCHEDARCRAVIDLDGIPFGPVVTEGLKTPGLFVLSDHSHEPSDASSREILGRFQALYDGMPQGGRGYFTVRNANHFSFSDQILLNSQTATWFLRKAVGFGGLDGRRGLAISADLVRTFFDVHLNGRDPAAIQRLLTVYPELQPGSGGAQ